MKKNIKLIVLLVGSLFSLPSLANVKEVNPTKAGMAMMRLQSSPLNSSIEYSSGSIWSNLRHQFRLGEVSSDLVRAHESKFIANRASFYRTINRSVPFMYHIVQEVQKRGMPAEIALLPFIESAYVTKAQSHVGASGLWQFMPATGRHYGLEQTPLYDGRHDIYASTNAALNYLQYLYGLFGDWSLALAAYNWGEGNVSRAIRRAQEQGLPPTYENLKMPAETKNYVPKLLAVRNLISNPYAFGLKLPEIANTPYFKEIHIKDPVDIMAAASLANISKDEFLALNPAFKIPVFIPKDNRKMLLPISAVQVFENNYKNTDTKNLLSWDVFTPEYTMDLNMLAAQTGNDVGELKRLNGLRSNSVAAGRTILLNKNSMAMLSQPFSGSLNNFAKVDFDPVPDTFVEQAPVLTQQEAKLARMQTNLLNETPRESVVTVAQNTVSAPDVPLTMTAPVETTIVVEKAETSPLPEESSASVDTNVLATALVANPVNNVVDNAHSSADVARLMKENQELRQKIAQVEAAAKQSRAQAEAAKKTAMVSKTEVKNVRTPVETKPKAETKTQPVAEVKKSVKTTQHKVHSGETLYSIAQKYQMSVDELMASNGMKKGSSLKTGQVLKVSAVAQAKSVEKSKPNVKEKETTQSAKSSKTSAKETEKTKAKANVKETDKNKAKATPTKANAKEVKAKSETKPVDKNKGKAAPPAKGNAKSAEKGKSKK